MKKILFAFKWLLIICGAASLILAAIAGTFLFTSVGPGNKTKIDTATNHDVRYVLNWCELGDSRIEKVLHSYISQRAMGGDHLDAFAIKVKHLSTEELAQKPDEEKTWFHCDSLTGVPKDAVSFAGGWLHDLPWFPQNLESKDMYVFLWSVDYHGTRVSAADLIFVRPSDMMIFFFSGET